MVKLPANYRAGEAEPAPEAEDVGASGGDRVLVIDDDADQCALMTKFLHREGLKVRAAGDTGLALARGVRPRAILLDVMMPGVDGWSVLSGLKADPGLADSRSSCDLRRAARARGLVGSRRLREEAGAVGPLQERHGPLPAAGGRRPGDRR